MDNPTLLIGHPLEALGAIIKEISSKTVIFSSSLEDDTGRPTCPKPRSLDFKVPGITVSNVPFPAKRSWDVPNFE